MFLAPDSHKMTLTYDFTPPSNPSPQLRAAQAWVEAANSLDKEKAASATADDYTHVFLPEDAGLPRLTREQWVNRVDVVGKTLAEFDVSGLNMFLLDDVDHLAN